ncbi:hypothetical protein [Lysobacter enzymogenes]|uniref:Uncharacterized protein n=1 Tax=Lysobacter enzymogenes TaxID=69 RepID=A0AAU9ASV6_LYSEN|nr:hypothetical protein [Lysobacter enzymogenes]MBO7941668.1 hypothetical protein [Streptomyces sp. S9]BAV97707.1 conserved hypothetical protein [Lysobacter enzymogenes]
MILSVLIITAPPMAGMFFNGVMSSYYGTNNFPGAAGAGGGGGANAAANTYRPGSPGYQPPPQAPTANQSGGRQDVGGSRRTLE